MHTVVGHCPKCGAPVYARAPWYGTMPPPSKPSCSCAGPSDDSLKARIQRGAASLRRGAGALALLSTFLALPASAEHLYRPAPGASFVIDGGDTLQNAPEEHRVNAQEPVTEQDLELALKAIPEEREAAEKKAKKKPAEVPPVEVAIAIGPAVSMGSDVGAKPTPFAAIDTWIPIHAHYAVPVLFAEGRLTSLPGESISLSDVQTWKALQFNFGASVKPVKSLGLRLYLEAGFTTRVPGDTAPRDRTARFLGGGIQVRGPRGDLRVGLYGDQRTPSDARYGPTAGIRGRLKLYQEQAEGSAVKGGAVYIFIDAILGLDYRYLRGSTSGIPVRRDVVVLGLAIGGKA